MKNKRLNQPKIIEISYTINLLISLLLFAYSILSISSTIDSMSSVGHVQDNGTVIKTNPFIGYLLIFFSTLIIVNGITYYRIGLKSKNLGGALLYKLRNRIVKTILLTSLFYPLLKMAEIVTTLVVPKSGFYLNAQQTNQSRIFYTLIIIMVLGAIGFINTKAYIALNNRIKNKKYSKTK